MKEIVDILKESRRLGQLGRPYALATVVKIGGSTYRRPGARMLIDRNGQKWGTISGGCLEGEVAQQALQVIESGRPRLMPFDLSDDDLILGFGTGCNGVVHVLIEPIPSEHRSNPLDALNTCVQGRIGGVMATVINATGSFEPDLGRHLLMKHNGEQSGCLLESDLFEEIHSDAGLVLKDEQRKAQPYTWQTKTYEREQGSAELLFEVVRPPIQLIILGEGHDVGAVVQFGDSLGWNVVVVGRKPADILQGRFPKADSCRFLMHPEELLNVVSVDPWSAALVMNHTYLRDRTILEALLQTDIPYIGMLGPRERTERMLEELNSEDSSLTRAQMDRVYGPVGLDIGTETPEEIALSCVAEIQAVLHGRNAAPLRKRPGPIHAERTLV